MSDQNKSEKSFFNIQDYLNGLRWRKIPFDELQQIRIGYRDSDRIVYVSADKIDSSNKQFFFVEDHPIPMHRVRIIKKDNEIVYKSSKYKESQDPDLSL